MEHLPSRTEDVRVLILHRDAILAFGLSATLHAQHDFQVQQGVHDHSSERDFDVIVCDPETGLALAPSMRPRSGDAPARGARVLVFGPVSGESSVRRAMEAGVHGYVDADGPVDELARGVRVVAKGQRYLSASVAQRLAESLTHAALTPREIDVLDWLAAGQCNKSIARQLGISVATVKAHVQAIMVKMDATSRTQAVSIAAHRGLVGLTEQPAARAPARSAWARDAGPSGGAAPLLR
jgi:DNA-binding NarL/FixJ family response regulator